MDLKHIIHTTLDCARAADPASRATFLERAIETFETMARDHAVPSTPVLALRIADVVSAWDLVRTLEAQVSQALASLASPASSPAPGSDSAPAKPTLAQLLTAAAKA